MEAIYSWSEEISIFSLKVEDYLIRYLNSIKIISEKCWLKVTNKYRGSMFELGGAPIKTFMFAVSKNLCKLA